MARIKVVFENAFRIGAEMRNRLRFCSATSVSESNVADMNCQYAMEM